MLKPGNKKTHRAYLWAYVPGAFEPTRAVVYDFCESRAGEHARAFLGKSEEDGGWSGTLVCDDYAAYKALFTKGITESGCMAHARRKLFELHANHSSLIAAEGLKFFELLYDMERDPGETTNVASDPQHAATVAELRKRLAAYRQ